GASSALAAAAAALSVASSSLYGSGDPRDLHSFPTRRSSDLLEVRGDPVPYASRGGLKLAHALDVFGIDAAGRVAVDVGASTGGLDRKSTRLNSSHVKISYAVFCLKKKRKRSARTAGWSRARH